MADRDNEGPNTEIVCKVSIESLRAARDQRRKNTLKALRGYADRLTSDDNITFTQIEILLGDQVITCIGIIIGTIMKFLS